jgi:hypothetical protein
MAIRFRTFKPVGIYLADIARFAGTSYKRAKEAAKQAGVTINEWAPGKPGPLSMAEAYKVLHIIRSEQGARWLNKHDSSRVNRGSKQNRLDR